MHDNFEATMAKLKIVCQKALAEKCFSGREPFVEIGFPKIPLMQEIIPGVPMELVTTYSEFEKINAENGLFKFRIDARLFLAKYPDYLKNLT